jgi:hypothetical protein
MTTYNYRICRFLTSLLAPDEYHDFAVVLASEREIALVGVDLTAYGLTDAHPLGGQIVERTFDTVWHRIKVLRGATNPHSGHDILERLASGSPSNLCFTSVEYADGDDDIVDAGFELFNCRIMPQITRIEDQRREQQETEQPIWRESPTMLEKWAALQEA